MGESASAAHAPSLLLDGDEDNRDDQPYDSFKIISRKALSDYKKAERIFLDFLASADVWSQEEVTATIIDFHLVEKCRTKFRAFVKSHGARVKFDPVEGTPRKQEYHGTVTVTRACKQQFLTQHPQVLRPGKTVCPPGEHPPDQVDRVILQCAAPTPITTGAQHIPFSADDALDAVAWDRPQLVPDFVSPRQAFHGQPSPRDTTTGVPPLRPSGQEAPVTGTGSLGVLPWVTLEARNTSQARASADQAKDQTGTDAHITPPWRAFEGHGIKSEPGRFGEDAPADSSWPEPLTRGPGLEGLSLSQTLAGHGLRDLPPVATRPRRLSLQDAFTSQICPPGLPGVRPTSISATGEDLLSHMHAGTSGFLGLFDSAGTPRRPMLRARRTSAPVGAAVPPQTPFSSIADIPARSNAADWFTRPSGDPASSMPPVGVRRMSEVHAGPHLSPRKSIRLDASLHDAAPLAADHPSLRKPPDATQFGQLHAAVPDAVAPDPFAPAPLDTLMPGLHFPAPQHRLRRQSDTDLLSGPTAAAALAPDTDLEGLRQLLSTDASAQRQAISASLPPRMASLETANCAMPPSGGGAAESKPLGPPHAEGVAEALLDSDPGMRCVSYSFPSVSPSQASPVGSPAPAAGAGGGPPWTQGTDAVLKANLAASGVGPLLSGLREGSGSDFGDVAGFGSRQLQARSLADLQPFGPFAGLDRDGAGYQEGGMQRSLSARECPMGSGTGQAAEAAAGGSGYEAPDDGWDQGPQWCESGAEHFQAGDPNKPKRTSM